MFNINKLHSEHIPAISGTGKESHKIKAQGFSIAEALITMFVVVLVVIMTMPVFTKKSETKKLVKGKWECQYNPTTQTHVALSDGSATNTSYGNVAADGGSCIFTPPAGANNFSVNIIGGGGGGASGTVYSGVETITATSLFVAPEDNNYEVVLIGGGGGGGAMPCGDSVTGGGGGAGGVYTNTFSLKKGASYLFEIGQGGERGGDGKVGKNGTDTTFTIGTNKYTASGGNGGTSRETVSTWTLGLIKYDCDSVKNANSGKAGVIKMGYKPDSGGSCPGIGKGSGDSCPGMICSSSKVSCGNAPALIKLYGSEYYGRGGRGGYKGNSGGVKGEDGAAIITVAGVFGGGGGKTGSHVYKTFKKLPDSISVKVGRGGAGAITENTDGYQGEASIFGSLISAGGGAGGTARYSTGVSTGNKNGQPGGAAIMGNVTISAGSASILNGRSDMDNNNGNANINGTIVTNARLTTYAGAGGGGGAALVNCTPNAANNNCWGKGGRGAPGIVIIEWN